MPLNSTDSKAKTLAAHKARGEVLPDFWDLAHREAWEEIKLLRKLNLVFWWWPRGTCTSLRRCQASGMIWSLINRVDLTQTRTLTISSNLRAKRRSLPTSSKLMSLIKGSVLTLKSCKVWPLSRRKCHIWNSGTQRGVRVQRNHSTWRSPWCQTLTSKRHLTGSRNSRTRPKKMKRIIDYSTTSNKLKLKPLREDEVKIGYKNLEYF